MGAFCLELEEAQLCRGDDGKGLVGRGRSLGLFYLVLCLDLREGHCRLRVAGSVLQS